MLNSVTIWEVFAMSASMGLFILCLLTLYTTVPNNKNGSFASAGDRTPVFQSVVRHYTHWATPSPHYEAQRWILVYNCNRAATLRLPGLHVILFLTSEVDNKLATERVSWIGHVFCLYSGSSRFEFLPEHRACITKLGYSWFSSVRPSIYMHMTLKLETTTCSPVLWRSPTVSSVRSIIRL
jgi:hypothetical protein